MQASVKRPLNGRIIFWLCLAFLAIGVMYLALRQPAVWVDAATIKQQDLSVSIIEEGKTRVKDRYLISAPVSGYLRRVLFNVGDQVEQAQLLVQLEPLKSEVLDARSRSEAEAQVAAAHASLEAARQAQVATQAEADLADKAYERQATLASQKLSSEDSLDRAAAQRARALAEQRSAAFNVDVARHKLAAAETLLRVSLAGQGSEPSELVDIRSPVKGSVLQRFRQSEGVVSAGQPLLELGDPSALEVVVDVLSFDAVKIRPGMAVSLQAWGGEALMARVNTVEPVGFTDVSALGVEEQRVRVIVDILESREHWAALGDGYRVDAHFLLWQAQGVLTVPESAVFIEEGTRFVYVIDDGFARRVRVKTGQSNGFDIQVEAGLEVGMQVVRHPDNQLYDGARVRTLL